MFSGLNRRLNELSEEAMGLVCRFRVPGIARAKGSPQVVTRDHRGRALRYPRVVHDTPKLREWEKAVAGAARVAMRNREPLVGVPIELAVTVYSKRPKNHVRDNGFLKAWAPKWVIATPDGDKMLRAIGDALNGIVYDDDARIARYRIEKLYAAPGDNPCAVIEVTRLDV